MVWFYGISTIVGYLMPIFLYVYIEYMINIFKQAWANFFHIVKWFHLFLSNTQLNVKKKLYFKQFSLALVHSFLFTQSFVKIQVCFLFTHS